MHTVPSKKSLAEKLGLRKGLRILILNPPAGYYKALGKLPKGVVEAKTLHDPLDFIHFFTMGKDELESKFPILKQKLSLNGVLWVSWPKRTARVETNLNESVVREIGLKNGLVDVKVISVDEVWSGLKSFTDFEDR